MHVCVCLRFDTIAHHSAVVGGQQSSGWKGWPRARSPSAGRRSLVFAFAPAGFVDAHPAMPPRKETAFEKSERKRLEAQRELTKGQIQAINKRMK